MLSVPTLIKDRTKVVNAKAERPSGAGLANPLVGALDAGQISAWCRALDKLFLLVETRLEVATEGNHAGIRVVRSIVRKRIAA